MGFYNKIVNKNIKSDIEKIHQDEFQDLFQEFSYKNGDI